MADRATVSATRWSWAVLAAAAALIYLADQATKALVVSALPVGTSVMVIGDLVMLWHVRNTGAAFSLLRGEILLFVVVTVFALGMIVYFHRSLRERGLWIHAVLGAQLGGALGNLTDRLRQGYVVDFVSVGIGDLRWPTFNVADTAIVLSISTLVIYLVMRPERPAAALA